MTVIDRGRRPPLAVPCSRPVADIAGTVFAIVMLLSLLFTLAVLGILDRRPAGARPAGLRRAGHGLPDLAPVEQPGQRRGRPGTDRDGAALASIVALVAFPIGILTAIYLEEYAADNVLAAFIDINIRNLAGVPSVVYGLLGLAVFVAALRGDSAWATGGTSCPAA